MKCWASEYGPCADGQSGEHLVSAALFTEPAVYVSGSLWGGSAPRRIGLSSLRSNTLCRHHNSLLSPLDQEAGRAFRALQDAFSLTASRRRARPRSWTVARWTLDGSQLERWFLKTAVNFSAAAASPAWWADPVDRVTAPLLNTIFIGTPLPYPAGLWAHLVPEATMSDEDSVEFEALMADGRHVGALFVFKDYRFLLWLTTQAHPAEHPAAKQLSTLQYHTTTFNHVVASRLSHVVRLTWSPAA